MDLRRRDLGSARIDLAMQLEQHDYLALGMMRLTRAGLAPASTLTTLQTSCTAATGEITRVALRSVSIPVMTNTCQVGAKISRTRMVSRPAPHSTINSWSSLHARCMA